MKETAADAFRVVLEGDDVVMEFGRLREPAGSGERVIALSERISLPLDAAKRLVLSLGDSLRPHAAALRAAEAKALSPAGAAQALQKGPAGPAVAAAPAGDRGALLLQLVADLGVPYQYERSFRISQGSLQANRFLLTLNKRDIPGDPRARALAICDRLGMPDAARRAAEEAFESANCLHFGFEGGPESVICKLYLERAVPADEAQRARGRGEPVPLHLAFKWDVLDNAYVVTRYLWHPSLGAQQIEQRLAHVYRGAGAASLVIARAVLALAAGRVAAEKLQYLEVQEDQNDRRSFDLNVYDARLQVKDAQQVLYAMRQRFDLRPGQFQALYDQIKARTLGHLAGGVHRDGREFFNVYYGVAGFPRFNERLG